MQTVSANVIDKLSFQAPFLAHDHRGMRFVPHWEISGDAIVKQSFLRVTPDKPHQLGHVWSRTTLDSDDFSVIWKFRISGRQSETFGDFLALSITTAPRYAEGDAYRQKADFTGVMVVVDTNPNDKAGANHFDVSIVYNDGSRADAVQNLEGCIAPLRFHEGRDDFNVLKASRLRIKYTAATRMLEVDMDPRNTGRWRRCATANLAKRGLPAGGWPRTAHVGLVAATTGSSDNHDVLSLRVYDTLDQAAQTDETEGHEEEDDDYMVLVHHMEHELYDVHAALQKTLDQLFQQEAESEQRIAQLESQLSRQVLTRLDSRLQQLETRVRGNVDLAVGERLGSIETVIGTKFEQGVNAQIGRVSAGWRAPFVVLLLVLAGVMFAAYKQYSTLKRAHHMY
ncbi:legume-like lectin family-domain-containing protein [Tribonema minus]|uniref:Legume-like lectin family-domain-containing protein n=1 Tax=Tribonema minus TaxID=303371 RepID=A0A835YWL8_9STRA|nr:legume-like lectin family-domain-containing protein [Tribonema minus]